MRKLQLLLTSLLLLCACASVHAQRHAARKTDSNYFARARQLVLVTTADWDAVAGSLQCYERKSAKAKWQPVGARIAVVVGGKGLGWGVGLHELSGDGPVKREGDGKAPAGIFKLSAAFGYAPAHEARWLKLPYLPLDANTECVDDVKSANYNLILDKSRVPRVDWNSSERMREVEGYRWGIVVAHNAAPPVPGKGSCIFLHIWRGPDKGTAGCTAMEQPNLETLMRWLDPKKHPVLVQLPAAEYTRLQTSWQLPRAND